MSNEKEIRDARFPREEKAGSNKRLPPPWLSSLAARAHYVCKRRPPSLYRSEIFVESIDRWNRTRRRIVIVINKDQGSFRYFDLIGDCLMTRF